jgi:hypothetical protein
MQKIFFLVVILFTIGLTPVLANDCPGNNCRAAETFNKEFKGATNVSWTKKGEYQEARFVFHEHTFVAYFTDEGELLGTVRDVLFQALPLSVLKTFERQYPAAYYVMIHEVVNEDGTYYWLTLEKGNRRYHVKSDVNGNLLKVDILKRKEKAL